MSVDRNVTMLLVLGFYESSQNSLSYVSFLRWPAQWPVVGGQIVTRWVGHLLIVGGGATQGLLAVFLAMAAGCALSGSFGSVRRSSLWEGTGLGLFLACASCGPTVEPLYQVDSAPFLVASSSLCWVWSLVLGSSQAKMLHVMLLMVLYIPLFSTQLWVSHFVTEQLFPHSYWPADRLLMAVGAGLLPGYVVAHRTERRWRGLLVALLATTGCAWGLGFGHGSGHYVMTGVVWSGFAVAGAVISAYACEVLPDFPVWGHPRLIALDSTTSGRTAHEVDSEPPCRR